MWVHCDHNANLVVLNTNSIELVLNSSPIENELIWLFQTTEPNYKSKLDLKRPDLVPLQSKKKSRFTFSNSKLIQMTHGLVSGQKKKQYVLEVLTFLIMLKVCIIRD